MKALVTVFLVAGCSGFHVVGGDDLGGGDEDGSVPGDLATTIADGQTSGDDLRVAGPADLAMWTMYGAGPLGALSTGYCCTSVDTCRSRRCISYGPTSAGCSDPCISDGDCNGPVITGMMCDLISHTCVPATTSGACLSEDAFVWGHKQLGACCDATGATPGSDCEGGWCISVGTANPTFCTQGCDDASPCPSGYGCRLHGGGSNHPGVCILTASLADPNSAYSCH
jgi:hypothetical protein